MSNAKPEPSATIAPAPDDAEVGATRPLDAGFSRFVADRDLADCGCRVLAEPRHERVRAVVNLMATGASSNAACCWHGRPARRGQVRRERECTSKTDEGFGTDWHNRGGDRWVSSLSALQISGG
jgi:hypothetical protein